MKIYWPEPPGSTILKFRFRVFGVDWIPSDCLSTSKMPSPSVFEQSCLFSLQPRLKSKIRTPHQSLTSHLSRLQRLQVASDALRRISRVVTLSKRLEAQMADLDRIKAQPSSSTLNGGDSPTRRRNSSVTVRQDSGLEPEGDLERVVSQAALYIAELCMFISVSMAPGNTT